MTEPVNASFDLAVDSDQVFRFEYGPATTGYVEPGAAPGVDGPVVDLPDGRTVKQVQVSQLESVFGLTTWRLTGDGTQQVHEADALTGYLAPDGDTQLVQLRLMPPVPQSSPSFPTVFVGDRLQVDSAPVLAAAEAAITGNAPEGWQSLALRCELVVRRMEVTATVTMADGQVRAWSPPAVVSQWLHRLRMRDYRSVMGVWFAASFEATRGGPVTHAFYIEDKPDWKLSNGYEPEHFNDELRLLPRRPESIPAWLLAAAAKVQQFNRADVLVNPDQRRDDPGGTTERVSLFDGRDERDRPVWYRPMVGRREQNAILHYLENSPLVLSARGLGRDEFGEDDEPRVPVGWHTDGRWVWSSAVAYYLREHDVPPALPLVDHIRSNWYRLPDEVPRIAMSRAAALVTGRDDHEARVAADFDEALGPVVEVVRRYQISPRFFEFGGHRDHAWCLVRDGDWYLVYRADGDRPQASARFGDVRNAVAYLSGQLLARHQELRYDFDEELPLWLVPYGSLGPLDPPLEQFGGFVLTLATDLVVDRYGTPDGNMVFLADTPFEQRGLPEEHAGFEYHRYLLPGDWRVLTAVSPAGGRMYLLPATPEYHLEHGQIQELTGQAATPAPEQPGDAAPAPDHPGLPPVTDALRAEARRNPGGWVWCADPDLDPRYIEGAPNHVLLGAYAVGPEGELTGETYLNPDYRPSPRKRGYPEPRTDFEAVLGLVAAGWLPEDRILPAALDAPFILETDGAGGLRIGVAADGRRFLAVYSSPGYVPSDANAPMQVDGRGLLSVLAGATLVVNPGGELGIELPGDHLIAAARQQPS